MNFANMSRFLFAGKRNHPEATDNTISGAQLFSLIEGHNRWFRNFTDFALPLIEEGLKKGELPLFDLWDGNKAILDKFDQICRRPVDYWELLEQNQHARTFESILSDYIQLFEDNEQIPIEDRSGRVDCDELAVEIDISDFAWPRGGETEYSHREHLDEDDWIDLIVIYRSLHIAPLARLKSLSLISAHARGYDAPSARGFAAWVRGNRQSKKPINKDAIIVCRFNIASTRLNIEEIYSENISFYCFAPEGLKSVRTTFSSSLHQCSTRIARKYSDNHWSVLTAKFEIIGEAYSVDVDVDGGNFIGHKSSIGFLNIKNTSRCLIADSQIYRIFCEGNRELTLVLQNTNVTHSDWSETHFDYGDLKGAKLQDSVWRPSVSLKNVNFEGADLTGAAGLMLDGNNIRNVNFGPHADIPWLNVMRMFTGGAMFFNLFLLGAFFVPLVGKTLAFVSLGQAQKVSSVDAAISRYCIAPDVDCVENSLIFSIFGGGEGLLVLGVSIFLFLYNLNRFRITRIATRLREDQELSGHAPWLVDDRSFITRPRFIPRFVWRWIEKSNLDSRIAQFQPLGNYRSYGWMIKHAKAAGVLAGVATVVAIFHLYQWLKGSIVYIN